MGWCDKVGMVEVQRCHSDDKSSGSDASHPRPSLQHLSWPLLQLGTSNPRHQTLELLQTQLFAWWVACLGQAMV